MKHTSPVARVLDGEVGKLARDHHEKIVALQRMPAAELGVLAGVQLADGVETPVAHGLGRAPKFVRESCVRGAISVGCVNHMPSTSHDPKQYVVLRADGFGATITCDLVVL